MTLELLVLLLLLLLTWVMKLLMMMQPRGGAVGIGGESVTPVHGWMSWTLDDWLASLVGACALWTTRSRHVVRLPQRLLVGEGRM